MNKKLKPWLKGSCSESGRFKGGLYEIGHRLCMGAYYDNADKSLEPAIPVS